MPALPGDPPAPGLPPRVSRSDVASGAALTALARMGAVIEVVTQPAFVWMFGLATYGLYIVLWAAVNLLATIVTMAMSQALQRIVPAARDEAAALGAVKYALLITVIPAALVALAVTLAAPWIAPQFAAAPEIRASLPGIIALFVWTLPLWVMLDVTTSAARARRAFGPEIRLRIFWEQVVRLAIALALFALGWRFYGLFAAHLASLALTAILSLRLLGRYFDLAALARAPMPQALRHEVLLSGIANMPPFLARRAFNDLPPVLLNFALSGTAGAVASGLFGIARKIASVPLIVRQTFLYVLAPLSAEQKAADPAALAPLYRFANRLGIAIVLPLTAVLIAAGDVLLMLFSPEAASAIGVLVVLLLGRAGETVLGAATPIVEMTGHRGLPLANSLAGLAVAALIGVLMVPGSGALGMAVAVAVGVTVASWAAAAELWVTERLSPFDRHVVRALAAGGFSFVALIGIGLAMADMPPLLRGAVQFALFWPLLWLALRFALDAEDKAALGRYARLLRL